MTNHLRLTYPTVVEEPDQYEQDLRQGRLTYPTSDPAAGFASAETSAFNTIVGIDKTITQAENAASDWLAKQLSRGAQIVGNAVYSAAGDLISKVSHKVVQLAEEKITMPKQRRNAPVAKTQPRKGPSQTMRVFGKAPAVAAPVAVSRRVNVKSKPTLKSGGKGLLITHREMIGQIITPATGTDFNAVSFVCNPGRFATFPWLSSLAGNFDKYIMRRLQFTTLSNQATSTSGRVGISFDYDSTDPLPGDRNEFFAMTHHAECAPWDSVTLNVPVDSKERFVNSHTLSDSKLIDIGQVVFMSDAVATAAGALNSTPIADVIVEYTVELVDPQQAIYSTMIVAGKNSTVTTLDRLPTAGPLVVTPSSVGSGVSTSTVFFGQVLQGYYMGSVYVGDSGGGSPTLAFALHGGTGTESRSGVVATATNIIVFKFKITSNDGLVRVTIGTVTVANLERLIFNFTRVSATAFNAATVADYDVATTTF